MNPLLIFLRGSAEVCITGVTPERCLNRFTQCAIGFWRVERQSELELTCRVLGKDVERAKIAATRQLCDLEQTRGFGLRARFYGVLARPILLFGLLLAFFAALFLQNFVWTLQVRGNETVPTAQILRELDELGVRFGTWGANIDSQKMKNRMLSRIPELSWLAVNRSGGVVTVLVSERSPTREPLDRRLPTNVVARSTGLITSMNVLNGFAAVEVGQAVREGELLVSGVADWNTSTQYTRALAEIYALTLRTTRTAIPTEYERQGKLTDTHTCISLILGRKRIKIFGNSSIFGGSCDKMTRRIHFTLPGGITLPLILEIETSRVYQAEECTLDVSAAKTKLLAYVRRFTAADMIAGRILSEDASLRTEKGRYLLICSLGCEEMISKTAPIYIIGEDEQFGTDD